MEIARKQLFEFNDMGPMPRFMKSILTDNIQVCHQKGGTAEACAPKIIELLEKSGAERIVDLCSGAGGPLLELERILREEYGRHPRFILTDLFPNIAAAAQINQLSSHIRYLTESVDATKMPRHLTGIRTIFAGFHHMDERLAFHVLASAFKEKQAIFILEIYYKRSLFNLLRFFAVIFFSHFFLALTNRPKWSQLLLTYLFPILPLMMAWDGAISCLRTYSLRELVNLTRDLQAEDYRWEIGTLVGPKRFFMQSPMRFCYIMGYPVRGLGGRREVNAFPDRQILDSTSPPGSKENL